MVTSEGGTNISGDTAKSKLFSREFIGRFLKFGVVGASGVVVNMGLFWLFHEKVLLDQPPTLRASGASTLAVVVSIFTNFLLNDAWTWRDRRQKGARAFFVRMARYAMVAGVAGAVQVGVVAAWVGWAGWNELLGNFVGIGAGVVINFVANHFWTFAPKEGPQTLQE